MHSSSIDAATLQKLLEFQDELISAEPDLATLMNLAATRSQALTKAHGAAIELVEGDEMVYRAVSGMASGQLGLRIPKTGSFSGLCVDRKEALTCDDSETDPRVNREACRAVGLRSMVVQPLFHRDNTIGIIKVMAPDPGAFSDHVPVLLGLLCRTVAGVLANAQRWSELEKRSESLSHLASHDSMTGLQNRSAFYDRLRQALAAARRADTRVGVALFDLDGLKAVNDTHGHPAGDFFIKSFAERLAARVRESDTVARLGGDEFGIVFPIDRDAASAKALVRQWADEAGGPLSYGEVPLELRSSAGVSVFTEDGGDIETLVALADQRLYSDKQARKRVS